MQPDSDFLLTANQMASSDTQERQSEALCCWGSRRLLAKERLCNKIGNRARLGERLFWMTPNCQGVEQETCCACSDPKL